MCYNYHHLVIDQKYNRDSQIFGFLFYKYKEKTILIFNKRFADEKIA